MNNNNEGEPNEASLTLSLLSCLELPIDGPGPDPDLPESLGVEPPWAAPLGDDEAPAGNPVS